MKLRREKDHSRQKKQHAPGMGAGGGRGGGKHGLFEKLRDVLNGQMVKNKEEPIRVETGKVINSEPRSTGEDVKLLPTCNEKALKSFKFGCFGCNKENCLERER